MPTHFREDPNPLRGSKVDFVEAENSMGFHADQEAVRILGRSIDFSRRGQIVLAGGDPGPLPKAAKTAPDTGKGTP
jgi:nitrite reductase (cytochrome c-552)